MIIMNTSELILAIVSFCYLLVCLNTADLHP